MGTSAKFLVLTDAAPRALLFDARHRLVGEVIEDDGYIVDRLTHGATSCPLPRPDMLDALIPPPSPQFPVRCFALDDC